MQRYLSDRQWTAKQRACCFLSLIPCLGHYGLLYMGKKSAQRRYTTLGTLYGILNWAAVALLLVNSLLQECKWPFFYDTGRLEIYYFLQNSRSDIEGWGFAIVFLVWIVCMIHTLCLSGGYLRYCALRQLQQPPKNPLVFHKAFRRDNLWWLFLHLIPGFYGFAPWFAGRRMKHRGLQSFGILTVALTEALRLGLVWIDGYRASWETYLSWALVCCGLVLTGLLHISSLLLCMLYREDYLDARAAQWVHDTHRDRLLSDPKWRSSNSLWQIWTVFPYVGGIGIALSGLKSKRRGDTLLGVGLCLITAAVLFGHTALVGYFEATYEAVSDNPGLAAAIGVLPAMIYTLYLLTGFAGICIHWPSLKGRAAALQGYASEFDRDADLYLRASARQTPPQQEAQPVPIPQRVPQAAPAPRPVELPKAAPVALLDINRCTLEEYMTLPGFTVAQAHRAMAHRQEQGGFRDGDEFVEVLQIKPHFAVQIFPLITAGPRIPTPAPAPEGAPRRRIDF